MNEQQIRLELLKLIVGTYDDLLLRQCMQATEIALKYVLTGEIPSPNSKKDAA